MRGGLQVGGGAVFCLLLLWPGLAWAEDVFVDETILEPKPLIADDRFGSAVALEETTAVVGASRDDSAGSSGAGAVYVFDRQPDGSWLQTAKLVAADAGPSDFFGHSVALSGNVLAVGAPFDDDEGSNAGAIYLFTKTSTGWQQQTKLTVPTLGNDQLGETISLDGDTLVAGVSLHDGAVANAGGAYVFERSGEAWPLKAKLLPATPATNDAFGKSVVVHDDLVVIGAPGDDEKATNGGVVFGYRKGDAGWEPAFSYFGTDTGGELGRTVAVTPGVVWTGAPETQKVFRLSLSDNSVDAVFTITSPEPFHRFGGSLAVDESFVAVGSHQNDGVFLFDHAGVLLQELSGSDSEAGDLFGNQLALDGGQLLIAGAPFADRNATVGAGAAYIFSTDDVSAVPDLLRRHAPTIHLWEDDFRPVPVEAMLDNASLWDARGLLPDLELLSEVLVGDVASPDRQADQYLNLRGAGPGADGEVPSPSDYDDYPTTVYGSLTTDIAEEDAITNLPLLTTGKEYTVLQYWFFYPYNNFVYQDTKGAQQQGNKHEGDWEMIQIILDDEEPLYMTTSWHWGGITYSWDDERLTFTDEHPHVFVGKGGHATWGEGGVNFYDAEHRLSNDFIRKITRRGDITPISDSLNSVSITSQNYGLDLTPAGDRQQANDWNSFLGLWGEPAKEGSSGPNSPQFVEYGTSLQGSFLPINRWSTPIDWANDPTPAGWDVVAASPVNIFLSDAAGNKVGRVTEDGSITADIPGTYAFIDSEAGPEWATVLTDAPLTVHIEGTGTGTMDLSILFSGSGVDAVEQFFDDVPITADFRGSVEPGPNGGPGAILQVDTDNDGETDSLYFGGEYLTFYGAVDALPSEAFVRPRRERSLRRKMRLQYSIIERRIGQGRYGAALRRIRRLSNLIESELSSDDLQRNVSSSALEQLTYILSELEGVVISRSP